MSLTGGCALCRLTSMITQLAKRPDVMQRLQQEQQELMRKHGSDITGRASPPLHRAADRLMLHADTASVELVHVPAGATLLLCA